MRASKGSGWDADQCGLGTYEEASLEEEVVGMAEEHTGESSFIVTMRATRVLSATDILPSPSALLNFS